MDSLILTFIGDDRPGLVHALAEVLSDHGGNWENSQMAILEGSFAGVLEVSVAGDRVDALVEDFRGLEGMLDVTVRGGRPAPASSPATTFTLDLLGDDHPGIVEQITAVLARVGVNVDRFMTTSSEAPMTDGRIFRAQGILSAAPGTDLAALGEQLEALAHDLMVDVSLGAPEA